MKCVLCCGNIYTDDHVSSICKCITFCKECYDVAEIHTTLYCPSCAKPVFENISITNKSFDIQYVYLSAAERQEFATVAFGNLEDIINDEQ